MAYKAYLPIDEYKILTLQPCGHVNLAKDDWCPDCEAIQDMLDSAEALKNQSTKGD